MNKNEGAMMRHQADRQQQKIYDLEDKIIWLEKAISVTVGRRLELRLQDIEADIGRLRGKLQDLENADNND